MQTIKNWPVYDTEDRLLFTIKTGDTGTIENAAAKLTMRHPELKYFAYIGKPVLLPAFFSVQADPERINKDGAIQIYGYECKSFSDDIGEICNSLNWRKEFDQHGYKKAVYCPSMKTVFCMK